MFPYRETKNVWRKKVITPTLIQWSFRKWELCDTHKDFHKKCVGTMRQKMSTKICGLLLKTSTFDVFWKTDGFLQKVSRTLSQKNVDRKLRFPTLFYAWRVPKAEFFRITHGFSYELFPYFSKNWQKRVIISYASKFPIPQFPWKTERYLYENYQQCERKKFRGKFVIFRFMQKDFVVRFLRKNRSVPLRCLRHCETKSLQREIVINLDLKKGISVGKEVSIKPLATRLKTEVSFLTSCKNWSKFL